MNRKRRQKLQDVIKIVLSCADIVDSVRDEEEEAMNNLPENIFKEVVIHGSKKNTLPAHGGGVYHVL